MSEELEDKVTNGASKPERFKKTREWVDKGKLGERTCTMIGEVWAEIEAWHPWMS